MPQLLLFPDPRPLVERLGSQFFQEAPQSAGVYLMRDSSDTVLYVGKAKNLRKRLASYRVANPDRLGRRHLRLLRAVERIELRPCADETSALENESTLLRTLRPRFNRAGTWPGTPRFLCWRLSGLSLRLAVLPTAELHWESRGPLGAGAIPLRAALARLLWCATHPLAGVADLPEGWFHGRHTSISEFSIQHLSATDLEECLQNIQHVFCGRAALFAEWIIRRTSNWSHPVDVAARQGDLEILTEFATRWGNARNQQSMAVTLT